MFAIVVHNSFDALGGAEAYSLIVAELLQRRFERVLVLYHGNPLDLDKVERWCRLSFDRSRVHFEPVPPGPLLRWLERWFPNGWSQLKYAVYFRSLRKRVVEADLLATTSNECTLRAKRVLQCIHYPQYVIDRESLGHLGWTSNSRVRRWLQMAYVEIVRLVAGWNRTYIGSLPTIANSNWTADQFCRHYPAHDIRAIHPGANVSLTPVSSDWVPFDRRENNFVIVGRVARSKRTDEAIKIVSRLRTTGLDVGLHIVGQGDDEFGSEIERMIADKPWVTWHKALSRDQLETLVTNQKWGLHCYRFEHYGIAPAELQALGCITFVHDSGGQREIILNPDQRYTSADDAVHKISAILRAPQMHQTLVADGLRTASQHTTDKFREKLLAFVEEIMQERASDVVKRDEQWTCM